MNIQRARLVARLCVYSCEKEELVSALMELPAKHYSLVVFLPAWAAPLGNVRVTNG